jgi:hypothetical protein
MRSPSPPRLVSSEAAVSRCLGASGGQVSYLSDMGSTRRSTCGSMTRRSCSGSGAGCAILPCACLHCPGMHGTAHPRHVPVPVFASAFSCTMAGLVASASPAASSCLVALRVRARDRGAPRRRKAVDCVYDVGVMRTRCARRARQCACPDARIPGFWVRVWCDSPFAAASGRRNGLLCVLREGGRFVSCGRAHVAGFSKCFFHAPCPQWGR